MMADIFNQLRLDGQLCDAAIKVDGEEFLVHKIVLCICSPYFRALFTQWSTPEHHDFDIADVSPEAMRTIIDFAYTGVVPVTSENVQELFRVADRFIVEGMMKACSDFMVQMLEPQNCISVWRFTDFYYHPQTRDKAFLFLLSHFDEVAATEDFLSLSAEELVQVIKPDQLRVKEEDQVFEAVLRWIGHAPEERKGHLPQLLSKVRLALTNPDLFIANVASNKLVEANRECRLMASNAMDIILEIMEKGSSFSMFDSPLSRPRLPSGILFVFGGAAIHAYDVTADNWVSVKQIGHKDVRKDHGMAYHDGFLYSIGGTVFDARQRTVSRFDLATHRWQKVASMNRKRCHVGVAVMDGYIYAVGGSDGRGVLESAERYRPSADQWTAIAPMNQKRSAAGCTSLRGKVYICGGFTGSETLSTAECYDPKTDQWTLIAQMGSKSRGLGVMASADRVFALGGRIGAIGLRSFEAYDPDTDTWEDRATMPIAYSHVGMALIDGSLFVIGSIQGVHYPCTIERYDEETDTWCIINGENFPWTTTHCCVASGFPNLAEYAAPRPQMKDD